MLLINIHIILIKAAKVDPVVQQELQERLVNRELQDQQVSAERKEMVLLRKAATVGTRLVSG